MPKRNKGESLTSASATSVSSQIQGDATEIADASVQTDTPVTDFQTVSSESEVVITSAALKLTVDVPCHDDTDSDYDSEYDDLDDNIFFRGSMPPDPLEGRVAVLATQPQFTSATY